MRTEKDLLQATVKVIPKLIGAYSILVIDENEPDRLIAFKNGPPMLVGIGSNEVIIASDIQAFIDRTHQVVYLEDGEIVSTHKGEALILRFDRSSNSKKIIEMKWDQGKAEKAGFDHFMQKEIFEQPKAVIQTMEAHIDHGSLQVHVKDTGFSDQDFLSFQTGSIDRLWFCLARLYRGQIYV